MTGQTLLSNEASSYQITSLSSVSRVSRVCPGPVECDPAPETPTEYGTHRAWHVKDE